MKKVIVGILLFAVLFVAGSAAQEFIYCTGYTQGLLDGVAGTWGPPPPGFETAEWYAACAETPNDPFGMERFRVPRFYTGNWFDKVVDAVKDIFA